MVPNRQSWWSEPPTFESSGNHPWWFEHHLWQFVVRRADRLPPVGLLTPVAVRIGAISWMPKLLPQIVWVDKRLQTASKGRVSVLDIAGLPNLALTVPGKKSGLPRTTPLLCVPHAGGWLIAGSYFGGPDVPLWVGNLRATANADIRVKGEDIHVTRREVEGEERARMWQVMLATWPNFAKYEQRTTRLIPVFYLERA